MTEPNGSWSAYEKLVMNELASLRRDVGHIDDKLTLLTIDVAQLKIKSGIWGATAGLVPALITAFIAFSAGGS
jgi:hypothetical protein